MDISEDQQKDRVQKFNAMRVFLYSGVAIIVLAAMAAILFVSGKSQEDVVQPEPVQNEGTAATSLMILPADMPMMEQIFLDVLYTEQRYDGMHETYLMREHPPLPLLGMVPRTNACLSISLDDQFTPARIDVQNMHASLQLRYANFFPQTAENVQLGSQMLEHMQQISDLDDGLIELCKNDHDLYLISQNGNMYRWQVTESEEGVDGSFTYLAKINAFEHVYQFYPEGLFGVPLVWTGYADAGVWWWEYHILDMNVGELNTIETCSTNPIFDRMEDYADSVESSRVETICTREYVPN